VIIRGQTIRIRTHNQNMAVAAMQIVERKISPHLSKRVAIRRQSLSQANKRSVPASSYARKLVMG